MNTDKIRDLAREILAELDRPDDELPTTTILVPLQMDLQAAINAAQPGTAIRVAAMATPYGPIVLRNKLTDSESEIVIMSDGPLPLMTPRIDDPHAFDGYTFPTIAPRPNEYGILCEPGAHHYRLVGLKVSSPGLGGTCIGIGDWTPMPSALEQLPHNIILDRCWCDGELAAKRGIAANGRNIQILNCIVDNIVKEGQDAQAVTCTNGTGLRLVGSYLRASGETVIIGGDDPKIPDLVPADIFILDNYIGKNPDWRTSVPGDYKNCFELKNARRVTVLRNVFEHSWADAQDGTGILFTVRNQGGHAPWSTIEDVEFAYNVCRHMGSWISILGHDDEAISKGVSGTLRGLSIHDNLAYDIGRVDYATKLNGERDTTFALSLNNGPVDVVVARNTVQGVYSTMVKLSPGKRKTPAVNFQLRANAISEGRYGIIGDGAAPGIPSWSPSFVDPTSVCDGNLFGRSVVDSYKYPGANTRSAYQESILDAMFRVRPIYAGLNAGIGDFAKLAPVPL